MRSIALKLPEDLLDTSDRAAKGLGLSRAEYIRRALAEQNRKAVAEAAAERMAYASRKVRGESMKVNQEFASIEADPDA